jgi:hypothetical protein
MRRFLVLLPLSLLTGCYVYGPPPAAYYPPPRPVVYAPPPPPPPRSFGPADPGNCGTPDEPRGCPPMPRVPLPYYPANR